MNNRIAGRKIMESFQNTFYSWWNGKAGLKRLNAIFEQMPDLRRALFSANVGDIEQQLREAEGRKLINEDQREKLQNVVNRHRS